MQNNQALASADARTRNAAGTAYDGALAVDKPAGWTSHDVVNKIRRLAGTKKVGHLGTLDPMATGVLPLLLGRATRLAQFFSRNDKVYEGIIRFGWSTDTYDAEGAPTSPETSIEIDTAALELLFDRFRGRIQQVPPPVSAKKIGGVPAYKLARKNIPVELPPVEVEVFDLALLGVNGPEVSVHVHCSSGTYIRSIAHDVGLALGPGAHLKDLRRIVSGEFRIEQAHTLDELATLATEGCFHDALIPGSKLLPEFSSQYVDEITVSRIRQGRDFAVSPFRPNRESRFVKALDQSGDLVAIGELKLTNLCHPAVVL